jgi:hypothetical protein
MRLLFCCEPFKPNQPDSDYARGMVAGDVEASSAASQRVTQRHVVLSPTIHNWIARRYTVSPDADRSEGEGTWNGWIGRSSSSWVPAWEQVSSLPRQLPGRLSLDRNAANNVPDLCGA